MYQNFHLVRAMTLKMRSLLKPVEQPHLLPLMLPKLLLVQSILVLMLDAGFDASAGAAAAADVDVAPPFDPDAAALLHLMLPAMPMLRTRKQSNWSR